MRIQNKTFIQVIQGFWVVICFILMAGQAFAEEETFMGYAIDVLDVDYIVLTDTNVRLKPDSKGKRVSGVKKREVLYIKGHHKGWLTIERDGEPIGFSYSKNFLPIVDGALTENIEARVAVSDTIFCRYQIAFKGKSPVDAEVYDMADYMTKVRCSIDGTVAKFPLFMFMTEGPYRRANRTVHQIGVDQLQFENDDGYDEIFSTTVLYDHQEDTLTFRGVTLKEFAKDPEVKEIAVNSVPEALVGAVEMTLHSWNDKVWHTLAGVEE